MWMWLILRGNQRSVLTWTNMTSRHMLLHRVYNLCLMTEGDTGISWLLLLRTIGDALLSPSFHRRNYATACGHLYYQYCCYLGNLFTNSPCQWVHSTFVTSEVKVYLDHQALFCTSLPTMSTSWAKVVAKSFLLLFVFLIRSFSINQNGPNLFQHLSCFLRPHSGC